MTFNNFLQISLLWSLNSSAQLVNYNVSCSLCPHIEWCVISWASNSVMPWGAGKMMLYLRWFPSFGLVTKNNQDLIYKLFPLRLYFLIKIECTKCEIMSPFRLQRKYQIADCANRTLLLDGAILGSVRDMMRREIRLHHVSLCSINFSTLIERKTVFFSMFIIYSLEKVITHFYSLLVRLIILGNVCTIKVYFIFMWIINHIYI